MPEKRPIHISVQNWKKAIAGAIVVLLLVCVHAQTDNVYDYNFFDNRSGLPTHISRKTRVDKNGTAWIATDAGIYTIPESNHIYKPIIDQVGNVPVWDIYFYNQLIYIGTSDSYIFVFDLKTKKLLSKISFQKFRKFRELNGKLFALGKSGIIEISKNKPQFWFDPKNTPSQTTVMDFSYWNGRYLVFQYGIGAVYSSTDGKTWSTDNSIVRNELLKIKLIATSAHSKKGQLYIGTESNICFHFKNENHCDSMIFAKRPSKSYAIWDIDSDNDNIYFALGNHFNFDEGSIVVRKIDKPLTFEPLALPIYPFIWGVTSDTVNRGIWANSITTGVCFIPNSEESVATPEKFEGFKHKNNLFIGWSKNHLYINKKNKWFKVELPSNIKKCLIAENKGIFIHAEKGLFHYNNSKLTLISPKRFQFSELIGNFIYVTEYFLNVSAVNVKTLEFTENLDSKLQSIINLKPLQNKVLAQTENNGYFIIHDKSVKEITLDGKKPTARNNYFFTGNLLISETGKELVFYQFDQQKSDFISQKRIDLTNFIPNQKIEWIESNLHGIWIFSNNTLLQLAYKGPDLGLQLISQFYIGKRGIFKHNIELTDLGCYVSSDKSIEFIPFHVKNQCSSNGDIDIDHNNYQFVNSSISGAIREGTNIKLTLNTLKFNQYQNGFFQIELIDEYQNRIHQMVHSYSKPVWLNHLQAGFYQIRIFDGNSQKNLIFRVNKPVFKIPSFWLLMVSGVGLLIFVLIYNQKDRFQLSEKLLSLEIATLKNNMNPHFIFNTMNLIQSLIVRSNVKQALKATSELAKLNRLFLETSNKDFIRLNEEIDYVSKYVSLEQMRFESDLLFQFQINSDINLNPSSWYVPPLILQPLLENAIKHGALMNRESTQITLNLDLASPHLLFISVRNEINQSRKPKPGTQIGLKLVRERLNLLNRKYPNLFQFQLNVESSPFYFTVTISVKRLDQNWIYE